jgi:hypothetical protein
MQAQIQGKTCSAHQDFFIDLKIGESQHCFMISDVQSVSRNSPGK